MEEILAALRDSQEALSLLLDRLAEHGTIDSVREEAPLQDASDAERKARSVLAKWNSPKED